MAKGNDIDLDAISMKKENERKSELTREKQRILWEVYMKFWKKGAQFEDFVAYVYQSLYECFYVPKRVIINT